MECAYERMDRVSARSVEFRRGSLRRRDRFVVERTLYLQCEHLGIEGGTGSATVFVHPVVGPRQARIPRRLAIVEQNDVEETHLHVELHRIQELGIQQMRRIPVMLDARIGQDSRGAIDRRPGIGLHGLDPHHVHFEIRILVLVEQLGLEPCRVLDAMNASRREKGDETHLTAPDVEWTAEIEAFLEFLHDCRPCRRRRRPRRCRCHFGLARRRDGCRSAGFDSGRRIGGMQFRGCRGRGGGVRTGARSHQCGGDENRSEHRTVRHAVLPAAAV